MSYSKGKITTVNLSTIVDSKKLLSSKQDSSLNYTLLKTGINDISFNNLHNDKIETTNNLSTILINSSNNNTHQKY